MKKQQKTTIITLSVIAVCVVGLVVLAKFGGSINMTKEQALKNVWEEENFRGRKESPVVITEYADFQCPSCAAYAPMLDELVELYGDRVAFVFRHFPLSGHDEAYLASTYAEAAKKQGKFFEFSNLLYSKQAEWGSLNVKLADKVSGYAEYLGMNAGQLVVDAQKPESRIAIDKGLAAGTVLNIPGTPTFFLNGERIATPRSLAEFSNLLDTALSKISEEQWGRESVEEYAGLAVFVRGKRVNFATEGFLVDAPGDIGFVDKERTIVRKNVRGITLAGLFETNGGSLTETCLKLSSKNEACVKEGESIKFFVNGLSRSNAVTYSFRPNDRLVISIGPVVDSSTAKQIDAVPVVPCEYSKTCSN